MQQTQPVENAVSAQNPVQPVVRADNSRKPFRLLLIIIAGAFVVSGAIFFTFVRNASTQLEKQKQNLVELPKGIDPGNLAGNQQEALIAGISDKYPNKTISASGKTWPVIQNIIVTQNNQPVLSGQLPAYGGVNITPTIPQSPAPQSPQTPPSEDPPPDNEIPPADNITCADTDNGKNYSQKGTTSLSDGTSKTDICFIGMESPILQEYYCENGSIQKETVSCDVCTDGVCVVSSTPQPCTDSDDGADYYQAGILDSGSEIHRDTCWLNYIAENRFDIDTNSILYQRFENSVVEYSCQWPSDRTSSSGVLDSILLNDEQGNPFFMTFFNCPNGCSNGACNALPPFECVDHDGGKDYYTKAETTFGIFGSTDECKRGDQNQLYEHYCNEGFGMPVVSETYMCPHGCEDGACKIPEGQVGTCTDTDDGRNYMELGAVLFLDEEGAPSGMGFDSCDENGDLIELFCEDEHTAGEEVYTCPMGCMEGACATSLGVPSNNIAEIDYSGFPNTIMGDDDVKISLEEIKALVEEYYGDVYNLYGAPFRAGKRRLHFQFIPSDTPQVNYLPQYDTIILSTTDKETVLSGLTTLFQGEYSTVIPESLRLGMTYAAVDKMLVQKGEKSLFSNEDIAAVSLQYQNKLPMHGSRIFYDNDVVPVSDRIALAALSIKTALQSDPNFIEKTQAGFYQIPVDSKDWKNSKKVVGKISSVVPEINGKKTSEWFNQQQGMYKTASVFDVIKTQITGNEFGAKLQETQPQETQDTKDVPQKDFEKTQVTPTKEPSIDISAECFDTDNGYDLFVAGEVFSKGKSVGQDWCRDSSEIWELTCDAVSGASKRSDNPGYVVSTTCPAGYYCSSPYDQGGMGACVKGTPSDASDDQSSVPSDWQTYSSSSYNYSISYPGYLNISETAGYEGDPYTLSVVEFGGQCSFNTVVQSTSYETRLDMHVRNKPGMTETTTTVAGISAIKTVVPASGGSNISYYLENGGTYYIISAVSASGNCASDFEQMVSSFHFQ